MGNINFQKFVASKLGEYSAAPTKLAKSHIIASVVSTIQEQSPNGGFLKKDSSTGLWYEAGEFLARERTSQAFRDALQSDYRSSRSFKKKTRQLRKKARSKISKGSTSHSQSKDEKLSIKLSDALFLDSFNDEPQIKSNSIELKKCLQPSKMPFEQIFDKFDTDLSCIDFEVNDLDYDLMSTCSSLYSDEGGIDDFKECMLDINIKPYPILEKSISTVKGVKPISSSFERGKQLLTFSSIPRCKTTTAMTA